MATPPTGIADKRHRSLKRRSEDRKVPQASRLCPQHLDTKAPLELVDLKSRKLRWDCNAIKVVKTDAAAARRQAAALVDF